MLDVNTVSTYPTHFLRAIELIQLARERFSVPSENWPYPTEYRFGIPNDHYYAEIFTDGMDWQPSYWVIEEKSLEKPQIQPLIVFDYNEDREKFNDYDFGEFIKACLYYRRDKFWIKSGDVGYFTDTIWPYLFLEENKFKFKRTKFYTFTHASQEPVSFWLNVNFVPEGYREKNRDNRNAKAQHFNGIPKSM
jgi:hypothetical protein